MKQQATNNEQMSYIPGLLRGGDPIVIPNHLKGSTRLQEIEEGDNVKNKTRKKSLAGIALDMTCAVVEQRKDVEEC